MKEVIIDGWVVMDEIEVAPDIHTEKPNREYSDILGKSVGYWASEGIVFQIDKRLFPNTHWDSEPQKLKMALVIEN